MDMEDSNHPKQQSTFLDQTPRRDLALNMLIEESEIPNNRQFMQMYMHDSHQNVSNGLIPNSFMDDQLGNATPEQIFESSYEFEFQPRKNYNTLDLHKRRLLQSAQKNSSSRDSKRKKRAINNQFRFIEPNSFLVDEKQNLDIDQENTQLELLSQFYQTVHQTVLESALIPLFSIPIGFDEKEGERMYQKKKSVISRQNKIIDRQSYQIDGLPLTIPLSEQFQSHQNGFFTQFKDIIQESEGNVADFNSNQLKISKCLPLFDMNFFIDGHTKLSEETKILMIGLRSNIEKTKSFVEQKKRQKLRIRSSMVGHACKICGEHFADGRQLGGHMSRRHPGHSKHYQQKKEVHRMKKIERKRRLYFKNNMGQNEE